MTEEDLEKLHEHAFEYRNAEPYSNAVAAWEALARFVEQLVASAREQKRA